MRQLFNTMTIIIDAHQDLAWNMTNLGRDYTRSVFTTRETEAHTPIPAYNGNTLLGWTQYQEANVAIVFGTLFCTPKRRDNGKYEIQVYETPAEAHKLYRQDLDVYLRLADQHPEKFCLLLNARDLNSHIERWKSHIDQAQDPPPPVGIVILMEGADGILEPEQVEQWYQWGVRLIGPAWAGNRYCGGTLEPGPLTKLGYRLLENMAEVGLILDISHMDHQAALQSLDFYTGQVVASHANAETLLEGIPINRHLKDETIDKLIQRNGVIGMVPMNPFLDWHWKENGGRSSVSLDNFVAHIDHVCQIAGNANHVGIGTDFDGGFGVELAPHDIDTIADLPKLSTSLAKKGYNQEDIDRILGGNWLRILRNNLPA